MIIDNSISKKLAEDMLKSAGTDQIIQKMKLIQGDIIMKRNFEENKAFLQYVIHEMIQRIIKGRQNGEKTTGFELMITECRKWIQIIFRAEIQAWKDEHFN